MKASKQIRLWANRARSSKGKKNGVIPGWAWDAVEWWQATEVRKKFKGKRAPQES